MAENHLTDTMEQSRYPYFSAPFSVLFFCLEISG